MKRQMDLEKIAQEVQCPICHEIMFKPMMTTACGHSFCHGCWDTFCGYATSTVCPMCRAVQTTPAILNKTLHHVIQVLFPNTQKTETKADMASFVRRIYNGMNTSRRFPRGYHEFMETRLATCAHNDIILCNCGLVAMDRTVRKDGRNKGRPFSSCPFAQQGCGHFQWLDTNPHS